MSAPKRPRRTTLLKADLVDNREIAFHPKRLHLVAAWTASARLERHQPKDLTGAERAPEEVAKPVSVDVEEILSRKQRFEE